MRRIALINQKGGVGKTTTAVNLGAALARLGRRVVLLDLDPQANASMHLGIEVGRDEPSIYSVLSGSRPLGEALRDTRTPGLRLVASNIDLSGAELELAGAIGREQILRDVVDEWEAAGAGQADYLLLDCPPSLGLLSVNALVAAREAVITLQTEFLALQGLSRLVEVVDLLRRRLNPELRVTGILPCLYDSRLRLGREVLAEIRKYFPDSVFRLSIQTNVKLAEAPSYGQTIFEYAPDSRGAQDYLDLAREVIGQETGPAASPTREPPTREVVIAPREPAGAPADGRARPRAARALPVVRPPSLPRETGALRPLGGALPPDRFGPVE